MKKAKYLPYILALVVAGTSCKKEQFVKTNTDPTVIYSIEPEEEFLNECIQAHSSDFEAYYDIYRRMMTWMQMNTATAGNPKNFLNDIGNFNQRYGVFFPTMGSQVADLNNLISKKSDEERPKYVYMSAIADIPKISYAFYVSDINGSIPYTEAFQARYGGTFTPKYDTQQELFALFNTRLKEIVTTLKTAQSVTQISLGKNDLYFGGDVSKWIKAANALRLRIALRLVKRDAAATKAIADDVLADASQMASNADSWVMWANSDFTSGGNWNPTEFRAPKPTVDFMWKNSDPRIRIFYQKNNYTQENLDAAIAAGIYPAGTTWNPRQYVGAHISPDSSQGKYKSWFTAKKVNDNLSLDTVSYLQWRMWQPANNNGTGLNVFTVITYADYCFMRAELIARGLAAGDAGTWYNNGVTASITFYDDAGNKAKVPDYTALGANEISDYLNMPDIKFNAAKALEQISIQAYLNDYKQPNEAWAVYKRTGMPNKNTALANEDIRIDGVVKDIPRRAAISVPVSTDANYETKSAAIADMSKDPDFGQGPSDMFGRVWWDKK